LYFARPGEVAAETPSLTHSNAFESVGEECRAARGAAGMLDISSFSKYLVSGPKAEQALGRVLAGHLPAVGRVRLTPMLAPSGRLMGDLTTMRMADDRFLVTGSGYLQSWHMRWFADNLVRDGVEVLNASDEYGGVAIFGPRSRELLTALAGADVSSSVLPFMGLAAMDLAYAPALVARLSVTGELGYEIYVPAPHKAALFDVMRELAPPLGVRQVGLYALDSLRLEKSFGIWSREFSRDYTPRMAGLDRFIAYDRPDFIGRDAALRDRETVPAQRLVTLAVESPDADAAGYEPICRGAEMVGFVTSGGHGHCAGTSLAMGYLASSIAGGEEGLTVCVAGKVRSCRVLTQPAIDPAGARMRS
jgi:dimethylglycine dehydrogenase